MHVAVTNIGDRVAEDDHLPFMIVFQYHGQGVLASNKKTVLTHCFYPAPLGGKDKRIGVSHLEALMEMLDKMKMLNYSI
jgi:hypothetical protein